MVVVAVSKVTKKQNKRRNNLIVYGCVVQQFRDTVLNINRYRRTDDASGSFFFVCVSVVCIPDCVHT